MVAMVTAQALIDEVLFVWGKEMDRREKVIS